MATRRVKRDTASSLFPFLSVLACVIGTLTLTIAALAIGQVAEDLRAAEADPTEQLELTAERAIVRKLERDIEEVDRVRDELATVGAELRRLGVRPDTPEAERRRAVENRLESASLAKRIRRLERAGAETDDLATGLRAALEPRARPYDESKPILLLPHGSSKPLQPFFVECRAEGIRVYHANLQESFYLSRASLDDIATYRGFLERVRAVRQATLIFLIRPDGVGTYNWAVGLAANRYVRHAKLPLPSQGEIRFSL